MGTTELFSELLFRTDGLNLRILMYFTCLLLGRQTLECMYCNPAYQTDDCHETVTCKADEVICQYLQPKMTLLSFYEILGWDDTV